jgi:hypothetical protein
MMGHDVIQGVGKKAAGHEEKAYDGPPHTQRRARGRVKRATTDEWK